MSAPPPLPPAASFLIPNEARHTNDKKKNDGESVGKQKRTLSIEIRDTLLAPPPLPEPPTPNAQHYDLPELDMKKLSEKQKMAQSCILLLCFLLKIQGKYLSKWNILASASISRKRFIC